MLHFKSPIVFKASYVPEIFVPSEKRILSPSFHDGYFIPPSGFSPAAAPTRKMPVRKLCHVPVWYRIRFMCSFAMCRLLLGRFIALKSSLHWPNVKRTKAVEEALNRWSRKALDDEMPGDLFLAALANSIEVLHLKCECKGITNRSITSLI